MSMVEDSLKSARNAQRLLLAACAVAAVFLVSLRDPSNQKRILSRLETIGGLQKSPYQGFVQEGLDKRSSMRSRSTARVLGESLENRLKQDGLLVLLSHRIAAAFEDPAHVGRIRSEDLDLDNASLESLDHFMDTLPVGKDVQLIFAQVDDLADAIADFILENSEGNLGPEVVTINNVQLSPATFVSEIGDTFLPQDGPTAALVFSFELMKSEGLTPIFEKRLPGVFETVSNSSWIDYLESLSAVNELVSQSDSGERRWMLGDIPTAGRRRMSLANLRLELKNEIEEALAENQTIDLPGLSIPGSLAIFGIPLAVLGFLGSLLLDLRHLHGLAANNRQSFLEFSWNPLSYGHGVWIVEAAVLLFALPILVFTLLVWRAPAFDLGRVAVFVPAVVGAGASWTLGVTILRSIRRLRSRLGIS